MLGLGPYTITLVVPVSDRDEIKRVTHTISVASNFRESWFRFRKPKETGNNTDSGISVSSAVRFNAS